MRHEIRAVLFDLDNTLADRDRAFVRWAHWFAREKLGCAESLAVEDAIAALVALDAGGHTPKDVLFCAVKEQFPRLADDTNVLAASFREQLLAHLTPLSGESSRLLDALDNARMPWGIVSNGSANQLHKIRALGLESRAACLVISEVVGVRKPDPAIFRIAAGRVGIPPTQVLFVGDHPVADIFGASMVGMRTAWLRRGREWRTQGQDCEPDHVVEDLAELLWVAEGQFEWAPSP